MIRKPIFKSRKTILMVFTATFLFCTISCTQPASEATQTKHLQPEWINNATIYEVNVRQYTPEGTFAAFEQHLPRLKDLGVNILWFMPIHPIGVEERKGTLGSYYSVRDYYGVNPEFGTLDDFKSVVDKAHELGMKVIIDIVANHTSRDAVMFVEHPDWYVYKDGVANAPFDWTDVAELDYTKTELRKYMIDMLKYWISDIKLDGFRCDVAFEVPTDFWVEARTELDKIKPVFMLAEAEVPELVNFAFVADYGWNCHNIINKICKGEMNANDFVNYLKQKDTTYSKESFKMNFITNHDENSWNGTEFERLGNAVNTFAAFTYAIDGMPLMYSGQEAGLNKRLQFFEKDNIDWSDTLNFTPFYTKLNALKHNSSALNALNGAPIVRVNSSNDTDIFAFVRENVDQKLFFVFNLSAKAQKIVLEGNAFVGSYTEFFNNETVEFVQNQELVLKPWDFFIYRK